MLDVDVPKLLSIKSVHQALAEHAHAFSLKSFDTHACRQSSHPVMAIFGHTGKAGVMIVESRGTIALTPSPRLEALE